MKKLSLVVLILMGLLIAVPAAAWHGPVFNFEGETITIYHWRGEMGERFSEGEDLAQKLWVEDAFNVKIEFAIPGVHMDFLQTLQTHVVAGESPAAIFVGQNQWMYMAAAQGLLLSLDDVLTPDYYDSLAPLTRNIASGYVFADRIYGAADTLGAQLEIPAVIWNKTKFEEQGLPSLYELYDDGLWTWEKFKELAIGATRDTTDDGLMDQYGVETRWGTPVASGFWQAVYMWAVNNGGDLTRSIDGRETFVFDEPEVVEAFEFWLELADAQAVGGSWGPGFAAGESIMAFNILCFCMLDQLLDRGEEWGAVPLPVGPSGTEPVPINRLDTALMLPITTSNPAAKIELVSALYRTTNSYRDVQEWQDQLVADWAVEGYRSLIPDWANPPRDRRTVEVFEWLNLNAIQATYWELIQNAPGFMDTMQAIFAREVSPAVGLAEIAPVVQQYIDEMIGQ